MENIKVVSWRDLSDMGLLYKINKEILHPLGLAVTRELDGTSKGAILADDGIFTFSPDLEESGKNRYDNFMANKERILGLLGA